MKDNKKSTKHSLNFTLISFIFKNYKKVLLNAFFTLICEFAIVLATAFFIIQIYSLDNKFNSIQLFDGSNLIYISFSYLVILLSYGFLLRAGLNMKINIMQDFLTKTYESSKIDDRRAWNLFSNVLYRLTELPFVYIQIIVGFLILLFFSCYSFLTLFFLLCFMVFFTRIQSKNIKTNRQKTLETSYDLLNKSSLKGAEKQWVMRIKSDRERYGFAITVLRYLVIFSFILSVMIFDRGIGTFSILVQIYSVIRITSLVSKSLLLDGLVLETKPIILI